MQAPDIQNITKADLQSNHQLTLLYLQFVRLQQWPNTTRSALEFWALAERALDKDTTNNPGRFFRYLIRPNNSSTIPAHIEQRAMTRLPSQQRHDLVLRATTEPRDLLEPQDPVQNTIFGPNVAYSHAVMMQCFLPQQPLPPSTTKWQIVHGDASLRIQAGALYNPDNPGEKDPYRDCNIPSGPKSRLIIPYIVGYAVRHKTRTIDLGQSLRTFMHHLNVPVSGTNGLALTREIQNVAAANFYLGAWGDNYKTTRFAHVASELSFWIDQTPDQTCFWTPEMLLSLDFYATIQTHRVPVDMNHLVQLARSPRRMDLYCWLSYRLSRIRFAKPVHVPLAHLHPIFGPNIATPRHFKHLLKHDLAAIYRVHPFFRITLTGDSLRLAASKPPIDTLHPRTTTAVTPLHRTRN